MKCCREVLWRSVLGMCLEPSVNSLTRFGDQRSRWHDLAPTTSYSGFTPLKLGQDGLKRVLWKKSMDQE